MKEKVMALVMAALLALALTGCGEDKNNTNRPGSDSNNTTNSGGNNANNNANGSTPDDGVTDSNGAARNGTNRSGTNRSGYGAYRDNGNDRAFNDNHGSTFGGVGEELQRDAEQFPPTVYDTMTGAHGAATWRQMLENGFVHDTDGFLLDGENACWS